MSSARYSDALLISSHNGGIGRIHDTVKQAVYLLAGL